NYSRIILLHAISLDLLVRPLLPADLLVMAAYIFSVHHALPTGPAAMACYFVAALQLESFPEKVPLVEEGPAPAEEDATPAKQDAATTQEDVISAEQDATTTEDVVPDPS